jgi:hypothetical protein
MANMCSIDMDTMNPEKLPWRLFPEKDKELLKWKFRFSGSAFLPWGSRQSKLSPTR